MRLTVPSIFFILILILTSINPSYAFRQKLASVKFIDLPNSTEKNDSIESIELKDRNKIKEKNTKSKRKRLKRQKVKIASEQKLGPVTLDLKVNPLNRRRNQASFNLDLIESYEIATHQKKMVYNFISWNDIKKLSSYISKDSVSSLIATVKDEFKEVE